MCSYDQEHLFWTINALQIGLFLQKSCDETCIITIKNICSEQLMLRKKAYSPKERPQSFDGHLTVAKFTVIKEPPRYRLYYPKVIVIVNTLSRPTFYHYNQKTSVQKKKVVSCIFVNFSHCCMQIYILILNTRCKFYFFNICNIIYLFVYFK